MQNVMLVEIQPYMSLQPYHIIPCHTNSNIVNTLQCTVIIYGTCRLIGYIVRSD